MHAQRTPTHGGQLMGNILLLRCDVANKSIYIDLCLCDKRFSKGKKGAEKVKMLDLVSFNPLVACKLRKSQKKSSFVDVVFTL